VVPGDVVDVQTFKTQVVYEGKQYFHELSEHRVNQYASILGYVVICKWQNMNYTTTLL
jgi:tRNA/tmRNA/rRNA uracil-C5-methylase (TrmA/RlmC/RlmD family)